MTRMILIVLIILVFSSCMHGECVLKQSDGSVDSYIEFRNSIQKLTSSIIGGHHVEKVN